MTLNPNRRLLGADIAFKPGPRPSGDPRIFWVIQTTTATTLKLSLGADGVNAAGAAVNPLVIADVKNEYSTIHLTLGAQNSFANIIDNGLITLEHADRRNRGARRHAGPPLIYQF